MSMNPQEMKGGCYSLLELAKAFSLDVSRHYRRGGGLGGKEGVWRSLLDDAGHDI